MTMKERGEIRTYPGKVTNVSCFLNGHGTAHQRARGHWCRRPPGPGEKGDALHLGGFPEAFAAEIDRVRVQFETLALAGNLVAAVAPGRLAVKFEREEWVGHGRGHPCFGLCE